MDLQAAIELGGKGGILARRVALLCFLAAGALLLASLITTPLVSTSPLRAGHLPDAATPNFPALRG